MNEVENNNQVNMPIENNKQEKEPSNKGKIILFVGIILLVLTLGIGGYFAYDKLFLNQNSNSKLKTDSEEEKKFLDSVSTLTKDKVEEILKNSGKEFTEINIDSIPKLNRIIDSKVSDLQELCYDKNHQYNEAACVYSSEYIPYKVSLKNKVFTYSEDFGKTTTIENVKKVKYREYFMTVNGLSEVYVITEDGYIYEGEGALLSFERSKQNKNNDVKEIHLDSKTMGYRYFDIYTGLDGKYYFTNGGLFDNDIAYIAYFYDTAIFVDVNRNVYRSKNYYNMNKLDFKYKYRIVDDEEELMYIIDDNNYLYCMYSDWNSSNRDPIKYPSKISKIYGIQYDSNIQNNDEIESSILKIEFENNKTLYIDSEY